MNQENKKQFNFFKQILFETVRNENIFNRKHLSKILSNREITFVRDTNVLYYVHNFKIRIYNLL